MDGRLSNAPGSYFAFLSTNPDVLEQLVGEASDVYDDAPSHAGLEQRRLGYWATGQSMSYTAQTYFLKEVKADPQFAFLKEAPAHVLQQALRDLDRAYQNFFSGRAGFPRPRRRSEHDSFRFPDPGP